MNIVLFSCFAGFVECYWSNTWEWFKCSWSLLHYNRVEVRVPHNIALHESQQATSSGATSGCYNVFSLLVILAFDCIWQVNKCLLVLTFYLGLGRNLFNTDIHFSENSGRVRVFSVKVGLITLCYGKLVDKLRCKSSIVLNFKSELPFFIVMFLLDIFSQISDENGSLVFSRFTEYLQEVLALPTMVLESPTFGYTEGLAATIFDGVCNIKITPLKISTIFFANFLSLSI